MTDRELLELAAKSAGIEHDGYFVSIPVDVRHPRDGDAGLRLKNCDPWNPLTDDGDALRLAVELCIKPSWPFLEEVHADTANGNIHIEQVIENGDRNASTRRAIVRAAAEIGKDMA